MVVNYPSMSSVAFGLPDFPDLWTLTASGKRIDHCTDGAFFKNDWKKFVSALGVPLTSHIIHLDTSARICEHGWKREGGSRASHVLRVAVDTHWSEDTLGFPRNASPVASCYRAGPRSSLTMRLGICVNRGSDLDQWNAQKRRL